MTIRRAAVVAMVVALIAALVVVRRFRPVEEPRGPIDVVVITIDTLRADHLGSYGDRRAATPIMDRLAAEGARFADVVAPVPLTLPSHASLFTGLTPLGHGVHDNVGFALGASLPTLAERLRVAGYETAAFVSAVPLQRRFGLARGFDHYDDRVTRGGDAARPAPVERRADETVAAAGAWLGRNPDAPQRPLFLWVHLFDPHAPYDAPEPFKTRFADRPYAGEVAFVDAQIGALVDHLRRARPDRRPLVVVTADHGEGLGDHGEPSHGLFVYDSTIRVPLILSGPGVPSGRVLQSMVRLIDVAPTVIELLRVPPLDGIEGVSVVSALRADANVAHAPAYVEALFGWLCCGWAPLHGWRDGRWILIAAPRVELYDVVADPGQLQNLAERHPDEVSRLMRPLEQALARRSSPSQNAVGSDTRAELRSLGYVSGGAVAKPSLRDPKDMVELSVQIARAIEMEDAEPAPAARELEAVLRQDPGNPLARRHLALALGKLRRFDEASGRLRALVADGDRSVETLLALGDLAMLRGDWGEAKLRLGEVYARDPSDTTTAFKLGVVSLRAGEMERAVSLFRTVVEREPGNADALVDLGGALLKTGRPAEAVTFFQQAIDHGATGTLAWNGLAFAKLQSGDQAGAADAMRQSLQVEPAQPDIRAALQALQPR